MSMSEWAKREVEIACKKENPDRQEDEFDYGCACYESALKAYASLLEDGHSGMSIWVTKHILNRLIDGQPLTPIEDTPDVWDEGHHRKDYTSYQCERYSALFKRVYDDGRVEYEDIDACHCVDVDNPDASYYGGLASVIYRVMYPITMPYMPSKPDKMFCHSFLYNDDGGDYDTYAIIAIERHTENGTKTIPVNRYFKELPGEGGGYKNTGWEEIYEEEYKHRLKRRIK